MAMGTERSKALHNFTLPGGLRWANQRFLRCKKAYSNGQAAVGGGNSDPSDHRRSASSDSQREFPKPGSPASSSAGRSRRRKLEMEGCSADDDGDEGIAAVREKVMFDLKTAAGKMKDASFAKDGFEEGEIVVVRPPPPPHHPPPETAAAETEGVRPWSLRTRRGTVKFPDGGGAALEVGGGRTRPDSGFTQTRAAAAVTGNSTATGGKVGCGGGERKARARLSVSLSKKEIEEDFIALVGHRPPRRPKKRHRTVQKQLETLFPGLWLSEVTLDMYKVPDDAAPH